ncbi:MAG: DNA helicase UvrD [Mesorhizobium sp.]|uniref:UvrD-helicase domain-containing protein n=1 Tax=Mesorhizobium sp. TaxID=1871066 RepID=UPI000FE97EC2|nr:UvrD-helicase domain-containing protein [Mesorhizobium sp.]RWE16966.1 MAG: DNA helicase UvrD [Mesorhizobium sp.]
MAAEIDLFAIRRGSVTAPAGCGKTHLIATNLLEHDYEKPALILTHTVAGVAALRGRLQRLGVPSGAYRLMTLDGWAIKLATLFPARCGVPREVLRITNTRTDYQTIQKAAADLAKAGHVDDILAASFSRQIVDEYQDCSQLQHALVYYSSRSLPTAVLGDPMQAVFGFNGPLPNWDTNVLKYFPSAGELKTPWRWINAGTEAFGRWLLQVRKALKDGQTVDLRDAPPEVRWMHLDGTEDHQRRLRAGLSKVEGGEGTVLIMGDSRKPQNQRLFASQTPGAVTVESVDLKDFIQFAMDFRLDAPGALGKLLGFAESVMTNVGATDLQRRVATLLAERQRKEATETEQAALAFEQERTFKRAVELLVEVSKRPGTRQHRPTVMSAGIRALNAANQDDPLSLHEAALRAREENRFRGRQLPARGVGSTLTLKGLEAEVAVILDVTEMDAKHLYVAMTRGSKMLVVCAASPVLRPVAVS